MTMAVLDSPSPIYVYLLYILSLLVMPDQIRPGNLSALPGLVEP